MSLSYELELTQTLAEASEDLSVFQSHVPSDWIEDALNATGMASVRRRKLPADQVMWLVLGMGLYRNRSITDVCDKLSLVMPTTQASGRIASSALVKARKRLGENPLRYLFLSSAQVWGDKETPTDFLGLKLLSVDGTTLNTPDSDENAKAFGYLNNVKDLRSGYPSVRLAALMSVGTHLIWDVAFGECRTSEVHYAGQLVGSAPAQSLTLFDRGFLSAELLCSWETQAPESHWLIPLKKKLRYTTLKTLGEFDEIIEMPISPQARAQYPHLGATWTARKVMYRQPSGEIKGFLTSLVDPVKYPEQELLRVYWQRWEIEEGYGEIKQRQLQRESVLRSRFPDGINQEIWGILLSYNIVRMEMAKIAEEACVEPQRISFVMSLRFIQDEFLWLSIASPGTIPKKLREMRENVKQFILPKRKRPPKKRTVKSSRNRYPVETIPR